MSGAAAALAPSLTIARINYTDPVDGALLVDLLDSYARDPMGGSEGLSRDVRQRLPAALADVPGAFSLVAQLDRRAVGLVNAFTHFSTFRAMPIINVHDVVVVRGYRGRGIGRALMHAVEAEARHRGACNITLEVLSGNGPARALYESLGYEGYTLDPAAGQALYWQKALI